MKKNEDLYIPEEFIFDGKRNYFNTLYLKAENVIIQDKKLGFEINFKEKLDQIDKLIIDGVVFVKENKDE